MMLLASELVVMRVMNTTHPQKESDYERSQQSDDELVIKGEWCSTVRVRIDTQLEIQNIEKVLKAVL